MTARGFNTFEEVLLRTKHKGAFKSAAGHLRWPHPVQRMCPHPLDPVSPCKSDRHSQDDYLLPSSAKSMKHSNPMMAMAGGKTAPLNHTDGIYLPIFEKLGRDYRHMRLTMQEFDETQAKPVVTVGLSTWLLGREEKGAREGIELLKWLAARGDLASKFNLAMRTWRDKDTDLALPEVVKLLEDVMAESQDGQLITLAANLHAEVKNAGGRASHTESTFQDQDFWREYGRFSAAVWSDVPGFDAATPNIGPHLFGGDDDEYLLQTIERNSMVGTLARLVLHGDLAPNAVEYLERHAATALGRRYIAHQLDRREFELPNWIDGTAPHYANPAADKDFTTRDRQVGPTQRTSIGTFQSDAPVLKDLLLSPGYKSATKIVKRNAKPVAEGAREADAKDLTVPERALAWVGSEFPGFFKAAEAARRTPMLQVEKVRWNAWCYLPGTLVARALLPESAGDLHEARERLMSRVHLAQAVNAWRMTKAVYRFEPAVLQGLVETKPIDKIPHELFLRMPDWCGYIPTPGIEWVKGLPMRGFFAHLDDMTHDSDDIRAQLKFEILLDVAAGCDEQLQGCIDTDPSLRALQVRRSRELGREPTPKEVISHEFLHVHKSVQLGRGTFGAAVAERTAHLAEDASGAELEFVQAVQRAQTDMLIHLAKIVLYLCSEQADITPKGIGQTRSELQQRQGRGQDVHPAKKIVPWGVGYRIGAQFRKAQDEHARANEGLGETGRSKKPHMRDSHYHLYWTGPKVGAQVPRVHWLPPIPVKARVSEDLITTVRPVVAPGAP